VIVKAPEERFATAPEGTFAAVCVDVIDLGMVSNRFDPDQPDRQMVRFVWQIDEQDNTGKPYMLKQDYTASLHEKAKLRKALEGWRGRAFTPTELFGFDTETCIGTGCLLNVVHNTGSRGGTFANVGGVMKLAKGMRAPTPVDYVRVKDRAPEPPKQRKVEEEPPHPAWGAGITDDDVPF